MYFKPEKWNLRLSCDASSFAVAAILGQKQENNEGKSELNRPENIYLNSAKSNNILKHVILVI